MYSISPIEEEASECGEGPSNHEAKQENESIELFVDCSLFDLVPFTINDDDTYVLRRSGSSTEKGSTCGITFYKARHGGNLIVHIPDGCTGGDDKASSMLLSHIDSPVRQHVPFQMIKWWEVPDQVKSYLMNRSPLCTDLNSHLTTLEQNYVILDSTLKEEVNTPRKDHRAIPEQMPDLRQTMTTTPTQLQTLTRQMGTMEQLL
ncbi:hypothetical protein CJ030_MR6G001840 [Morella rubra]|uniref:Uncharacterized protein n=1 Tax=Morella rubra TaxID=262757 RepID=A0A6A1VAN7_9ROSI|nr:hypothetical protein CJ030_MR6G001840 [Morella rubra]